MNSQSTIEDLKAAIREVEEKKRRIDEDHRGLLIALRYFEGDNSSVSQIDAETGIYQKEEEEALDVPW